MRKLSDGFVVSAYRAPVMVVGPTGRRFVKVWGWYPGGEITMRIIPVAQYRKELS